MPIAERVRDREPTVRRMTAGANWWPGKRDRHAPVLSVKQERAIVLTTKPSIPVVRNAQIAVICPERRWPQIDFEGLALPANPV